MPSRKSLSWKQFEKFLYRAGCTFVREKGDHRIYVRQGIARPLVVPRHNPLPLFVIRNNLKVLGVGWKEFEDYMR